MKKAFKNVQVYASETPFFKYNSSTNKIQVQFHKFEEFKYRLPPWSTPLLFSVLIKIKSQLLNFRRYLDVYEVFTSSCITFHKKRYLLMTSDVSQWTTRTY